MLWNGVNKEMTEPNGSYPITSQRHEDDCNTCLEPQYCDCLCNTCRKAREDYYCSQDYDKYLKDMLDPKGLR